ncbi:MAG: SprB repeat-containing protein, partial [Bacteroidetes bacterium]|nr:SprB repeat-containing protein [Bacteroidota bacterium]
MTDTSGATFTGLAPGYYTATTNGICPATTSFNIVNTNSTLAATVSFNDIRCNGEATTATINATGGTGTLTYVLNGVTMSSNVFANLPAGAYVAKVTDANGCTYSLSFDIDQPTPLSLSLSSQSNVMCHGLSTGSAIVIASGGTTAYNYSVLPNTATVTGNVITAMSAGDYTVTVTDNHGCISTLPLTISEPATALNIITASTVLTHPSCHGGTTGNIDITVVGGTTPYAYVWSNGTNAQDASTLSAGTYTVTVTDANGCTTAESYTLTEPSTAVSLTSEILANTTCNASVGQVKLISSDHSTITLNSVTDTSGATFTGLLAGYYTATTNGTCPATTSFNIVNTNSTLAATVSFNDIRCNGGTTTATIEATGGALPYSFVLNGGIAQGDGTFTNLGVGSYNVLITDNNGCSYYIAFVVHQPTLLVADIINSTNNSCNGSANGKATVNVTGGTTPYTYLWNTIPPKISATVTGLAAGTYTVTVTDNNSCSKTADVIITEPSAIIIETVVNHDVTCYGGNDGLATAEIINGTQPYIINWSNGSAGTVATGLHAGTYTVNVYDVNGCYGSNSVTIIQPVGSITANAGLDAVICGNDGVSYQLSGNSTNSTSVHWTTSGTGIFSNSDSLNAIYTPSAADITDAQIQLTLTAYGNTGCEPVSDYMVLTINPIPFINTCFVNDTICVGSSTQLGTSVNNGCGGCTYNYSWTSNPAGYTSNILNPIVSPSVTTIYTLVVTNPITLCSITKHDTVTVNPTDQIIQPDNQVVCNGTNTSLVNIIPIYTAGITTYSWINNQTSIGLAASGTGNIPSFVAVNNGTTPVTATIIVSSNYNYGGVICEGLPKTFTITVNPTGEVNQPQSQV